MCARSTITFHLYTNTTISLRIVYIYDNFSTSAQLNAKDARIQVETCTNKPILYMCTSSFIGTRFKPGVHIYSLFVYIQKCSCTNSPNSARIDAKVHDWCLIGYRWTLCTLLRLTYCPMNIDWASMVG